MAIFSKKLFKELFVTLFLQAMLLWIVLVALFVFVAGDEGFELAWMYLILLGIGGCWGDACALKVPLAPFFITFAVLFFIVRYTRSSEDLMAAKKKFFAIYLVIFLVVGLPVWPGVIQSKLDYRSYKKHYAADEAYYWKKYGTEEEVVVPYKFIYSDNDSVLLRDANGLYELSPLPIFSSGKTQYISPKGNFFVRDQYLGSGYKDEIIEVTHTHTQFPVTNLDILKPKLGYSVEPESCAWSNNEQYLACLYDYAIKESADRYINKNGLVLFDIGKRLYIYIYEQPPYRDYKGFSFNDTATALYYDYDNSIYKVDNLQEMSQSNFTIKPHIVKLDNMRPCQMVTYDNNAIYCSVKAEEIGKTIQDQSNPLVEGSEFFVIKQNLNQPSPEDYQVLNLAPLGGAYQLTVLSDTYISSGSTVINMKTGRIVKNAPDFGLGGSPGTRAVRYWGDK